MQSINIEGNIIIPQKIIHETNEYIITEISEESFKKSQIKSLIFEDNSFITSIPKNAFSCSSIQHLHIPTNIKELKDGWCHRAFNLTNITISPNNKYFKIVNNNLLIGKSIDAGEENYDTLYFANRNVSEVSIPSTIKQINSYSFEFCQNIRTVNFSNKSELIKICKNAFSHSAIELITIPKHVSEICEKSFYFCTNIRSFQFEEKSELKTIGNDAFSNSSALNILIKFESIPEQYELLKNKIDNSVINKMYSKFSFKYFSFKDQKDEHNVGQLFIFNLFIMYLKNFKFIVYHTTDSSEFSKYSFSDENYISIKLNSTKINCILCTENECIIIEQIDKSLFSDIVNNLKKLKISIVNANYELNEEINSFCKYDKIKKIIMSNDFVKYTIKSIIGYLIGRFYYPSDYFKDSSFFNFDQEAKEQNIKTNISDYLYNENDCEKTEFDNINNEIKTFNNINTKHDYAKYEFNENEFIELKPIYNNDNAFYRLVIHLQTLHIFLKKNEINLDEKYFKREMNYCKYSHRCLTRFYGFLMRGNKIVGFIYEFMSGRSLDYYIENNNPIDEIFLLTNISRIFQGIDYLHSNELIHRDLKPQNILIDHDGLAYISDFETIRSTNLSQNDAFTNDIGTPLYMSIEQDQGKNISYSTDIYSFGLIIYYMYEKKHLLSNDNRKERKIIPMTKGQKNIRSLYEKCAQIKPEDRIKNEEIKLILNTEFNSYYYIEQYLMNKERKITNTKLINFIFEKLINQQKRELSSFCRAQVQCLRHYNLFNLNSKKSPSFFFLAKQQYSQDINDLGDCYRTGHVIEQHYEKAKEYYELSAKFNNPEAIFNLGFLYETGKGVEQDYIKAKKYYERAAELNDSDALNNLGALYENGLGVEQDYSKAKVYYEKAVELNNECAYNNLGSLYEDGNGVEQDYLKAKKYYEKAAELNNSDALNNLGALYERGLGVGQDYSKAKEYYERAVELNNEYAYNNLGFIYMNGTGAEKNYLKAKEYFEKSAKCNNSEALLYLGSLYEKGRGVEQSYLKAMKYYEQSAELNNSEALLVLGNHYCDGLGVKQDYLKAKKYYEQSANLNNSTALINLGHLYANGKGVEQSYLKAKEYYEQSAELGNSEALFGLGNLYKDGKGVEQDYSIAIEYYEQSAELGNSDALNNLGNLYKDGKGVDQDYSMAKEYYEESAVLDNPIALINLGNLYADEQNYLKAKECYEVAAELNNPDAFLNLGHLYYFGSGVEQNYLKAKEYYEQSALFNNSEALLKLGIIYTLGQGIEQDYSRAVYYYKRSAELNNSTALFNLGILYAKKQNYQEAMKYLEQSALLNNSDAFNEIGDFYFHGLGVKQNYNQAFKYFEQSAKLNNPNAFINLGNLYEKGIGVEQDYSKAIKYYEKSALSNNSDALNNLGDIFYFGHGVKQNYEQAVRYYEKSSKLNNSNALNNLGIIYKHGLGVKKDYEQAMKYFEKAAELNNPTALFNIGSFYLLGQGVEQDFLIAKKFYEKSAKFNNSNAIYALGILYEEGLGVKQNYRQAIKCYEQSAELGNLPALFQIGDLLSNGDMGFVDLTKAIEYFSKSIEIHNGFRKIYDLNGPNKIQYEANNFRYISYNNLGLIYLIEYNDLQKAEDNLKESAFAEYPYGQNNFGLFCQFYLNEIGNAEYMFQRSSKHKFSLAEYNLGYLKEIQNKPEESIEYYIQASEHEDEQLEFRDAKYYDRRFEISRTFIICYTNLKLVEHFFSINEYKKSKMYFIRAFKNLNIEHLNYHFYFKLQNKEEYLNNIFSYLKRIIFNFPLFNLINQPNLDLKRYSNIFQQNNNGFQIKKNDDNNTNAQLISVNENMINKEEYFKLLEEKKSPTKFSLESKHILGDDKLFEDPSQLFDYIMNYSESNPNSNIKMIFIKEIIEITIIMKEILYTPPYLILFGRIYIIKPKLKEEDKRKDIDQNFYDGFGIQ